MLLVRARRLFRHRKLEWLVSYVLLGWGVALLSADHTFSSLPSYAHLERWAPQAAWAWFCILTGGARVATLLINGQWARGYWLRVVGAVVGFNFWAGITIGFAATGGWTAVVVYHGMAIAELINAYQIMRDHYGGAYERAPTMARNSSNGDWASRRDLLRVHRRAGRQSQKERESL